MPEIDVAEQPKKHRKIEEYHTFSHFNWVATASNLVLVLVLMSFITPTSCMDYKTRIDKAGIKMTFAAGEDDIRKGIAFTYLDLYQYLDCSDSSSALFQSWTDAETFDDWTKGTGSQHAIKLSGHATEYTAFQMHGDWGMERGSGHVVKISSDHATEDTVHQLLEDWIRGSRQGHGAEITGELSTEDHMPAETLASEPVTENIPTEIKSEPATIDTAPVMTNESPTEETIDREMKDINMETAKDSLKPPSPPSDLVEGYNPWLDEPRPTTIEEYLRNFEVVFVVDDSSSMEGTRWSETRDAMATIFEKAFELKTSTLSVCFLNNARYVRGLQGKSELISLFDKTKPRGLTPLGKALKAVFSKHLDRIDSAVREGSYSEIPPLDIIVLTDGMPTDQEEDEPAKVIANAVKRLTDSHYHPNTMNVQIIQIANEQKVKRVFRDLVVGDNGRIVDTVPYAGIVDSEKLLRILLGVHPNIRSQLPTAMLAT